MPERLLKDLRRVLKRSSYSRIVWLYLKLLTFYCAQHARLKYVFVEFQTFNSRHFNQHIPAKLRESVKGVFVKHVPSNPNWQGCFQYIRFQNLVHFLLFSIVSNSLSH